MYENLSFGNRKKLELLLPYLKKNQKILDLGCGSMWLTKTLRAKGYNCIGFALKPPADIIGDIKKHPFKKHSFDVVIALEMLEHVDCRAEIDYILKPKGLLIASSPVPHFDWLCLILEKLKIFQDRGTPHSNLFYLDTIPYKILKKKILFGINQFYVFRK